MAFFKGSYYQHLPPFRDGDTPFRGVRARPIVTPEPVLEHSIAVADRLDGLGQHYYGEPRDWRRLADCNPDVIFPEDLLIERDDPPLADQPRERLGEVIVVPRRREGRA